jgi:hypothetical protein
MPVVALAVEHARLAALDDVQAQLMLSYEDRARSTHRSRLPQKCNEQLREGKYETLQLPQEFTEIFECPEHELQLPRLQRARDALS